MTTLSTPCDRVIWNIRAFHELSVVVNIRERSWMTRRRIVTETGASCTKSEAELMHAMKRLTCVEPSKKKLKVEIVEAIDLT